MNLNVICWVVSKWLPIYIIIHLNRFQTITAKRNVDTSCNVTSLFNLSVQNLFSVYSCLLSFSRLQLHAVTNFHEIWIFLNLLSFSKWRQFSGFFRNHVRWTRSNFLIRTYNISNMNFKYVFKNNPVIWSKTVTAYTLTYFYYGFRWSKTYLVHISWKLVKN